MITLRNLITYDIVSSPGFTNATLHSSKNEARKVKINKILFKIKKPLI